MKKKVEKPFLHTKEGIVIEVKEEFLDLTGFSIEEIMKKTIIEIGSMLKANFHVLLEEVNGEHNCYIFTKKHEVREVFILSRNLDCGNERMYIFSENVSYGFKEERGYIEQLLLDNKIGVAVHSIPELILLKTNQKYLDFQNPPYNSMKNAIGTEFNNRVNGFAGSAAEEIFKVVMRTGESKYIEEFEYVGFYRGITYWDSAIIPVFIEGKIKYIIETVSEVTERVLNMKIINEQSKEIKNKNELLNRMIDNLELPFIRLSCPDLKILEINQKAFDIINGLTLKIKSIVQLRECKVLDIFQNFKTSDYYKYINEVMSTKKTKYLNGKSQLFHGSEVYWNVIFEPVEGLDKKIQEIIVLIIDVTSEVNANRIMEKALKAQEEFVANISHELKTPLNVIYSVAQLLNMYTNSDSLNLKKDLKIKYINSIMHNCHRLSKLINNIVDLSKIEAGFFELNLSNNNIVEVVEEIVMSVTDYTDIKDLSIIFDTDTEEKIIACDPEKIERIVLNLISNAIKFSEAGNEIYVNIKDNNEYIEISVTDNGIGIEKDYLNIIFDRFKQVDKSLSRNAAGTGIGLSLTKSIVELHQGTIKAESESGKWSKFTVTLPNRKVMQENMMLSSKMRNKNESIQVEFSDICY